MPQPTPYELAYDFVGWQIANATRPLPASKLEIEFNAIEDTIDQILTNLALIQRDDGEIANGTVGYDQLKPELALGLVEPVEWATGVAFSARDTAFVGSKLYRAVIAHTAGVFATDLAAGKWEELTDLATGAGVITSFNSRVGVVVPEVGDYAAFYQPLDADLTALAGLTSAANKLPYFTGSSTAAVTDLSAYGRSLIDDADAATARATLGLVIGTNVQAYDADLTTWAGLTPSANAQSLVTAADYAAMRTLLDLEVGTDFLSPAAIAAAYQPLDADLTSIAALATTAYGRSFLVLADAAAARTLTGLVIGTNVQAYDAELAALAGLTSAADKGIQFTGAGTAGTYDLTAFAKTFLDDADAATVRTTLGLAIGTNVQAYDAELAALAGLTSAADKGIQFTGSGTAGTYDLSAFAKTILDDADAAAVRTTLGLVIGTNVQAYDADLAAIAGLSAPGADRILFWDDSASSFAHLTLGTNLSISGTTLNASAGGGSGLSDGDYGDITVSGSGTAISIDDDVVTFAKMQNVATARVMGRLTAASGDIEELTFAQVFGQIDGLTEDTAPSGANDYLVSYDASATAAKKVKPDTLLALVNGLTADASPAFDDYILSYDTSASAPKKILGSDVRKLFEGTAPLTSDLTTASTTFVDATGCSFTAAADTTYVVEVYGTFQSSSTTTGIGIGLNIPSGAITGGALVSLTSATSNFVQQNTNNAILANNTGVAAANTNYPIIGSWLVRVEATGGTVQLRYRSETAANTTLKAPGSGQAGTYITWKKIA